MLELGLLLFMIGISGLTVGPFVLLALFAKR